MRMKTEEEKRVLHCQGKNLRLNIPLTTPSRTLSAMSYLLEDLVNQSSNKNNNNKNKLHINKTKLHHAEKMIKRAFIELYKGLTYLKTYRNLNMLAFIKILKKFDKVSENLITLLVILCTTYSTYWIYIFVLYIRLQENKFYPFISKW